MEIPSNQRMHSRPMPVSDPCDGVLLVDKESGPTSHDVVDLIRRRFRFRKVGHGGTLDPQATGLLVMLLGRGTKLAGRFIASDKTYVGTMRLGIVTDSQDAQGVVTREADCSGITREQLEAEIARHVGDVLQTPPMVSAIKKDGIPLYKRARRGEVVEREPKLVHIFEFKLLEFNLPRARFTLTCTKGTYVRTLCADIGEALGCGAHLEELRRTRSGHLKLEDAVTMKALREMSCEDLCRRVIPLQDVPVLQ